jgi:hypothetical protein
MQTPAYGTSDNPFMFTDRLTDTIIDTDDGSSAIRYRRLTDLPSTYDEPIPDRTGTRASGTLHC